MQSGETDDAISAFLEAMKRWPRWLLILLSLLAAGIIAMAGAVLSHILSSLWPSLQPAVSGAVATVRQAPIGVQAGVMLAAVVVVFVVVALAVAGVAAREAQQDRDREEAVVRGLNSTGVPSNLDAIQGKTTTTLAIVESMQSARTEEIETLAAVKRVIEAASFGAIAIEAAGAYGRPFDSHRLEAPVEMVGREEEREKLRAALAEDSDSKGAWVYGPTGAGKSAIVNSVAHDLGLDERFPDGVVYLNCVGASATEAVRAVIQRFDPFRKLPAPEDMDTLRELLRVRLAGKRALIVLDGPQDAERFRDAPATLVSVRLSVRVVVLSSVQPPTIQIPKMTRIEVSDMSASDAQALFLARMGRDLTDPLTDTEREDLEYIVGRLDYLPLAIVRTAVDARAQGRTLSHLAEDLRRDPGQVAEHQLIRDIYQRSFDGLEPNAQTALTLWGAFGMREVGRNALLAALTGMGVVQPAQALHVLRDRFLAIVAETQALPAEADTERWQVHLALFEIVQSRFDELPAVERDKAMSVITCYFAEYAQDIPLRAIAIEEPAIVKALEWALPQPGQASSRVGLAKPITRLSLAIARFWRSRWANYYSLAYLKRMIIVARAVRSPAEKRENALAVAELYMLYGRALRRTGELERAERYFRRGLRIRRSRASRDIAGQAVALHQLGQIERIRGRLDQAERYSRRALVLAHSVGDLDGVAHAMAQLGRIYMLHGNNVAAMSHFERALALFLASGDMLQSGVQLGYLGRIERMQGHLDRARDYFTQSKSLAEAAGDLRGQGVVLSFLARIARTQGDLVTAATLFDESLSVAKQAGDHSLEAIVNGYLGRLELAQGNLEQAFTYFAESFKMSKDSGHAQNMALILGYMGRVRQEQGRLWNAAFKQLRALRMVRRIGEVRGQGIAYEQIARLAIDFGRLRLAFSLSAKALAALGQAKDVRGQALTEMLRGEIATRQGKLDAARQIFMTCLQDFQRLEDRRNQCWALYWLARVDSAQREYERANTQFARATELAKASGSELLQARCLYYWGLSLSQVPSTEDQGNAKKAQAEAIFTSKNVALPHDALRTSKKRSA